MPFAQLPDAQIHYEWAGAGDLPVLVFSNSLGTSLEMWNPQLSAFTQHFRVLRYDTRGHGQSTATPVNYTIGQLANDVLLLLDVLQLSQVALCGLSLGGATGIHLGAHAPHRFSKLVLCNTAAKFGTADTWNARIQAVTSGGMQAVASAVIERWLTPSFRASHPAEAASSLAMLESANPSGYLSCCAAVRDTDLRGALADVAVPSLVLTGTHDPVTPPSDARYLVQNIPGARYVEVSAAHLSNLEAREDFNHRVLDFLLS